MKKYRNYSKKLNGKVEEERIKNKIKSRCVSQKQLSWLIASKSASNGGLPPSMPVTGNPNWIPFTYKIKYKKNVVINIIQYYFFSAPEEDIHLHKFPQVFHQTFLLFFNGSPRILHRFMLRRREKFIKLANIIENYLNVKFIIKTF